MQARKVLIPQGEQGKYGRFIHQGCEIPRLLLICEQRQIPTHRTSKVQGKDEVTAKVLTSRSNGWRYEKRKQKPKKYIRGWAGYYHLANMKRLCQKNYEWLRQRIRMYMECLETPQDQKKGPHQKRSQGLQRTTMGLVLRRLFLCPQKNSVFLLFVMMSTSMDCPITFMLFIRSVDIGHTIILS